MEEKKQNNNIYIFAAVGVVAVLVLVIGGVLFVKNSMKAPVADQTEEDEFAALPPVDPSVGVSLTAKSDKRSVVLSVSNIPSGVTSIEYELTYNTGEGLPKGALGKMDVNSSPTAEKDILLGTCSRNTCTYDEGVTSVNLVLKFNHPKGASQFTKEFAL